MERCGGKGREKYGEEEKKLVLAREVRMEEREDVREKIWRYNG